VKDACLCFYQVGTTRVALLNSYDRKDERENGNYACERYGDSLPTVRQWRIASSGLLLVVALCRSIGSFLGLQIS
jgi:hypothetical protein